VNSYKPQSGKHWSEDNLTLGYKGQADQNPVPRSPTIPWLMLQEPSRGGKRVSTQRPRPLSK